MTYTQEKQHQNSEQKRSEQKPSEAWTEFVPTSKLHNDAPEDSPFIRTSLPLPARPIVKGGFAIALCSSGLLVACILFQLASDIKWNQAEQSNKQENQPVQKKPDSEMTTQEKLQWCLANGKCTQKDPLNKLTPATKAIPKVTLEEKKPSESAALPPSRLKTSSTVAQDVEHPYRSYTIAQDARYPARFSRYIPPPKTLESLPSPPVKPRDVQPVVRPPVVTPTSVKRKTNESELQQAAPDPIALLAQASKLGIYTTVEANRPTESVASQRLVEASTSSTELILQAAKDLHPGKVIPMTTRIKAEIATSISWVGSKTEQKFRITTTEDVQATDGSIVVPKNTYLLAQVNQSNTSGYVEVQILSAQIDGQEKPIPTDAIIVQGTKGEPLIAKVKNKGRGLNNMVVAAGLAGISSAAETINSPQINVGRSTTTVSSNSNVGAAIAQGVAASLSGQIANRVSQTTRNRTEGGPVLVLKEGTKLELFVNQPLSF